MYPYCCGRRTLASIVSFAVSAHAIWPSSLKRFSGNSLVNTGSMGLSGDGRVIAFGDFNGDQLLDVLVLDQDLQTLTIYYWSHDNFLFERAESFKHTSRVYNVVPGDFTHSGKLDLLIMSPSRTKNQLDLSLYPALVTGGFDSGNVISVDSSTHAQPVTIDVNGDLKIDLLGQSASLDSTFSSSLQVWKNVWSDSQTNSSLFVVQNSPFPNAKCTPANPHSNAVVDLDGDCLADVFLVCDDGNGLLSYQIWVNKKTEGFSLSQQGPLPRGTQAISFADMDRDGTTDMVFSTCSRIASSTGIGTDCYINIAYNKQLKLCASSTDLAIKNGVQICRRPDNLCSVDANFEFDITESPDNDAFVRFPVSSLMPDTPNLLVLDTTFSPAIPVALKLGDANLDGFPDILMIGSSHKNCVPHLVYSVPCAPGVVGCGKSGGGRRGWEAASKGVSALANIKDARSLSFIDMDEDGTLDIMVQRSGSDGQGTIMFVQNNFYYDAFFLKAIVLNGACDNSWCYAPNGSEKYHPFGVSYSGASYKYTVLDTSGHRSAAQVCQLPQTSYQSLHTPYSFFGLGRTNNYIENLFVGTTVHAQQHYINMEGVIPNSKVVILPSADENAAWKRELFLRPGEWIPWVTLTVIAGMIMLATIVLVLHLNDKREDEMERRRASHHINFDAL